MAFRKPNGVSLNVWALYAFGPVGDPLRLLHRELMKKIERVNDRYGAGQIDVAQWYTALARATHGALTMAADIGESKKHERESTPTHP